MLLSLQVDKAMLLNKFMHLFPSLNNVVEKLNYLKAGVYVIKDWIKQSRNVGSEASYYEYNSLKQCKDLGRFAENGSNSWIAQMSQYRRELQHFGIIGANDLAVLGHELKAISEEMKSI